jgi:hypothetical protein
MYVRIVTFSLTGATPAEYEAQASAVADEFTRWPGLLGKIWLADQERNRFGGVYLFAAKADAERSRSTPLFAELVGNPCFFDVVFDEFDTLAGLTAFPAARVEQLVGAPRQ